MARLNGQNIVISLQPILIYHLTILYGEIKTLN